MFYSFFQIWSVTIIDWTGDHGRFVVETLFYKTTEFVIAIQVSLGTPFMLHWNDADADKRSILL